MTNWTHAKINESESAFNMILNHRLMAATASHLLRPMRVLNFWFLFIYVTGGDSYVFPSTIDRNRNDYMMEVQCRAKCLKVHPKPCTLEDCLAEFQTATKYGTCPRLHSNETFNIYEHNCIDSCRNWDFNCPEAEKCCPHSCGTVCQRPTDVDKIKALPPIPISLSFMEIESRTVELCWRLYDGKIKTHFFVIEGRFHVGSVFANHKLGDWIIFNAYPRYDHVLKENLIEVVRKCCFLLKIKPGRWYQFRVASFNENGTRGFSKASNEFQLKDGPKFIKPPRNLTISVVQWDKENSNRIHAQVQWMPPKTNFHVDKYKIFWALHLPGDNNPLTTQHAIVHAPKNSYELKNVIPNSVYYIQVQALSVFGRKRMKTEKVSKLLNTTITDGILKLSQIDRNDHYHPLNQERVNTTKIPHLLMIRFMATKSNEFIVKINWPSYINYTNFRLELCQSTAHCLDRPDFGEYRSVNINRKYFEFLNLKFSTQYTVRLKAISPYGGKEHKIATLDRSYTEQKSIIPKMEDLLELYNHRTDGYNSPLARLVLNDQQHKRRQN